MTRGRLAGAATQRPLGPWLVLQPHTGSFSWAAAPQGEPRLKSSCPWTSHHSPEERVLAATAVPRGAHPVACS